MLVRRSRRQEDEGLAIIFVTLGCPLKSYTSRHVRRLLVMNSCTVSRSAVVHVMIALSLMQS